MYTRMGGRREEGRVVRMAEETRKNRPTPHPETGKLDLSAISRCCVHVACYTSCTRDEEYSNKIVAFLK